MGRFAGVLLILAGAALLYIFAVNGSISAAVPASRSILSAPFLSLGSRFPADVLTLLGAGWAILLGLYFVLVSDTLQSPTEGFCGRILFLNSLLGISALFLAWVGSRTNQSPSVIGAFAGAGLLQLAVGVVLVILSLTERPKAPLAMPLGLLLWCGGIAAGVFAWTQGT